MEVTGRPFQGSDASESTPMEGKESWEQKANSKAWSRNAAHLRTGEQWQLQCASCGEGTDLEAFLGHIKELTLSFTAVGIL